MSNRFGLKDFGRTIPLQSVTDWLTRSGWAVIPDNRGGLLCKGPPDDDGNPITCTVPEDESYRDYELRLEDLIATVAIIEERPAIEIVDEMLASTTLAGQQSTSAPTTIDSLIGIVEQSIGVGLSIEDRQRLVNELTPILGSAELAAVQTTPLGETARPQEVAMIAVRLVRHLPTTEGTKLAIWRVCSRLLLNRFALTPDELDAFYATAISDKPDEPEKTLQWLQKRLSQSTRRRTTKGI